MDGAIRDAFPETDVWIPKARRQEAGAPNPNMGIGAEAIAVRGRKIQCAGLLLQDPPAFAKQPGLVACVVKHVFGGHLVEDAVWEWQELPASANQGRILDSRLLQVLFGY